MIEEYVSETRENRTHSQNGIKFFAGTSLPNRNLVMQLSASVTADQLREDKKVWRPEETLDAAKLFFYEDRVNVIGDPQSGKGTILFGLSEVCDLFGWGYLFVDGHHQETPAKEVVRAIEEANDKNIPIFFDSFDYLFGKSRNGIRGIPLEQQHKRTPQIVSTLDYASVPIAITNHDDAWAENFLDLNFRERFKLQIDRYPIYKIPLNIQSDKSIVRFLIDHNIPQDKAEFLVGMSTNPDIINKLIKHYGDKDIVAWVFEATRTYPVLKELARERKDEFLETLANAILGITAHPLAHLILEADHKRIHLTTLRRNK